MTVRRILLAPLTTALVAGPLGTTAARASFVDSAPVGSTAITTATVEAPGSVAGSVVCGSQTISVTWQPNSSPDVVGYRVTEHFNKYPDETTDLLPSTATSWSGTSPHTLAKSSKVQLSVTTVTSYGWTADSLTTGMISC